MADRQVGIIMGSSSDADVMREAGATLDRLSIPHEDMIISAHRTPSRLSWYAEHAESSGMGAIIAGAGGAAHLPGMIASFTTIPVVGVPIYRAGRPLAGVDALLSISEMPTGSPVATMGINKAGNAAIYAAKILGVHDGNIRKRLEELKKASYEGVVEESDRLTKTGLR